jgi:uncharacterized protein (DUF305 family)
MPSPAGGPRTVQPGAPGQSTRSVAQNTLSADAELAFTEADVRFVQGMVPHHAQALVMTELVRQRSRDDGIQQLALRMDISQRDEIALMERWLRDRDRAPMGPGHAFPPQGDAMEAMGDDAPMRMPGMLTAAQLDQLSAATGAGFDRLFLELMIQHHEGAIAMVEELFSTRGGGQGSEIFQLASHIDADQRMEIDRMRAMLSARR